MHTTFQCCGEWNKELFTLTYTQGGVVVVDGVEQWCDSLFATALSICIDHKFCAMRPDPEAEAWACSS